MALGRVGFVKEAAGQDAPQGLPRNVSSRMRAGWQVALGAGGLAGVVGAAIAGYFAWVYYILAILAIVDAHQSAMNAAQGELFLRYAALLLMLAAVLLALAITSFVRLLLEWLARTSWTAGRCWVVSGAIGAFASALTVGILLAGL